VWRYEVETESEIYRISTIPTDFIGNSSLQGEGWTPSMKAAYKNYKSMQDAVAIAEANLKNGPVPPGPSDNGDEGNNEDDADSGDGGDDGDHGDDGENRGASDRKDAALRALQKEVYCALKSESKAREDFLKVWPSALGSSANFDTHIMWSRKLERRAREVQKEPRKYFYSV
jgi:hypothetical protein